MSDKKPMFSTKDPLGRTVQLQTKTWNMHIVKSHNELYKQEFLVKKVIEKPIYILRDRDYENRENYFQLCHIPQYGCLQLLKVNVEFLENTGDVVTAYTVLNNLFNQASTKRGVIYEQP